MLDYWVTLAELRTGVSARISSIDSHEGAVHRLMEMGLVPGTPVAINMIAPFGGPIQLRVRDTALSLRRADARHFIVEIV